VSAPDRDSQEIRRVMRVSTTVRSFWLFSECSQMRTTRIPSFRNIRAVRRSRCLFRSIFASQKELLVRGMCPHRLHPCQKQPSTKIAMRCFGKKKSGRPDTSVWCNFQPRILALMKAVRRIPSVLLLLLPRMDDIMRERVGVTPTNSPFSSLDLRNRSIDQDASAEK